MRVAGALMRRAVMACCWGARWWYVVAILGACGLSGRGRARHPPCRAPVPVRPPSACARATRAVAQNRARPDGAPALELPAAVRVSETSLGMPLRPAPHTQSRPISKAPMHAMARNDCIDIGGRLAACTRTQAHIPHVQPPRITGTCPLALGVHLRYFGTLTVTCTVAFKVTITECHMQLQIWLW